MARPHEYLFLDEAGFNLQKRRQRGRNIIGQRAITEVPGQRGGNITLCAAMGLEGLVHRHAVLGSYNTQRLLTFLEELKDILLDHQQHHPGPAHHIYVIIWDNVRFHRTNQIREWFTTNSNHFLNVCLPPYSPFLNPIEEFFSSWRWKVYDRQPYTRENLLSAMELACVDIPMEAFQGWIHHSRAFFPRCLARDNIACDVDEVMWPDAAQRHDAAQWLWCVCGVNKVNKKTSHPDHVFKSTVVCNRFCFCIELCYSSVHAEFSIDLYSSYETHKSKCLILCRDLRRSITVKFLKICIGSYETKNLLTNWALYFQLFCCSV